MTGCHNCQHFIVCATYRNFTRDFIPKVEADMSQLSKSISEACANFIKIEDKHE